MTIEYSPTADVLGANDLAVYVVYDATHVTDPKFRYICQVFDGSTELAKLKQLPNSSNAGVFDVHRIVSDYVKQDENIHGSAMFTNFTTAFKPITLKFGYEYAATAVDQPIEYLNQVSTTATWVNAQFEGISASYGNGTNATYIPDGTTKKFASVLPTTIYAQAGDYGTLSLINTGYTGSRYLYVRYFSGSTPLNAHHFTIPATSTAANRFVYIGAYPGNLEAQTIDTLMRPSTNAGWTHYTLVLKSGMLTGSPQVSQTYTIYADEQCKYPYTRFAFWNQYGGWDYVNFRNAIRAKAQSEQQRYESVGGNWFNAGPSIPFARATYQGGMQTTNAVMRKSYTASTGFYEEEYNNVFLTLLNSPRVLRYDSGNWIPVVINTNQLNVKTVLNDKLVEYEFEFQDGKYEMHLR